MKTMMRAIGKDIGGTAYLVTLMFLPFAAGVLVMMDGWAPLLGLLTLVAAVVFGRLTDSFIVDQVLKTKRVYMLESDFEKGLKTYPLMVYPNIDRLRHGEPNAATLGVVAVDISLGEVINPRE